MKFRDFKTVGTRRWYGCQPYAPAAPLLEAESTKGSQCGQKGYVNEKFQRNHRESNLPPFALQRSASPNCTTGCPTCDLHSQLDLSVGLQVHVSNRDWLTELLKTSGMFEGYCLCNEPHHARFILLLTFAHKIHFI